MLITILRCPMGGGGVNKANDDDGDCSTSTWTRSADACAKNTSKLHAVIADDQTAHRDVSVAIHAPAAPAQQPFRYFLKSVNSPPYIRFSIPGRPAYFAVRSPHFFIQENRD